MKKGHSTELEKTVNQLKVPAIVVDSSGSVCALNTLVKGCVDGDIQKVFSKKDWKSHFIKVQEEGFWTVNKELSDITLQFIGSIFKSKYVVFTIHSNLAADQQNGDFQPSNIELLNTEQLSSIIVDSLVNLVATFDTNLNVTYVNRTILQVSGYSKEELIGKSITNFVSDKQQLSRLWEEFENKEQVTGRIVLQKKTGESVAFIYSVSKLKNAEGKELGFVCSLRDISDIEGLKAKLAFIEERYTDLIENASDLIQGVDIDGKIQYANKAWHKVLGYSKTEMKRLNIIDLVVENQKAQYRENIQKLLAGEEVEPQILKLVSKKGTHVLIESSSDLKVIDNQAHIIRSIMRDITQTRQTELLAQQHAAKIEAIFEGSRILFWTVDKETRLTSFNSQYRDTIKDMYGVSPELKMKESEPKKKFADQEYHNFWFDKYQEVLKTRKNVFFQTETESVSGGKFYREIYLNPVWSDDSKTEIAEIAGMAIDITAKKQAEQKIVEQTAKIRTIFNATPHMIWSLDKELRLTSFNDSFRKKMEEHFDVTIQLGEKLLFDSKNQKKGVNDIWKNSLQFALAGNSLQFEINYVNIYNKEIIDDIYLSPIRNEKGEVVEIAVFAQNVTFKKLAEKKLRNQTAKISAIFDSSAMLIWTIDKKFRIVSYNKIFADNYFHLKGMDISLGSSFLEDIKGSIKTESYKNLKEFYDKAFQGERQQFEGVLYNAKGEKVWTQTFLNPIYSDDNEVTEVASMSYEITDKKVIEEQMIETIREKEVLLKEVHHRVKNNLQVISSILNLQSSYVKDENSLKILRESQNRIKSMSFIHESLYHTGNFSQIEFSEYIYSLTTNLIHSYSFEKHNIELKTDFEKTFLSLDQAIPCGLIVNEIISNALKYAFEPDEGGEIYCSIASKDNHVVIKIGDNGIGIPSTIDYKNSDTLGLQLIYTLIEQLSATIEVDNENGTNYFITFEKQ